MDYLVKAFLTRIKADKSGSKSKIMGCFAHPRLSALIRVQKFLPLACPLGPRHMS
jgi:hypothetical protein